MSAVQENGGYILVHIDSGGYIYHIRNQMREGMMHLETRDMQVFSCEWAVARARLPEGTEDAYGGCPGILELSPEGGGQAIYVTPEATVKWAQRLRRWHSCYGRWPLNVLAD